MDGGESGSSAALAATAALIDDLESDDRWGIVRELQRRGDKETFDVVAAMARSGDRRQVGLTLDVLGQLGFREGRPWLEESVRIALEAIDSDAPNVQDAAIAALEHLGDKRGLSAMLGHFRSADSNIRLP